MLTLEVKGGEFFNETLEEFITVKSGTLQLEHSLISVRKWEMKWHKPFLHEDDKSMDEIVDYIRCMTINSVPDPNIYSALTPEDINKVITYIEDPMTATWFTDDGLIGAAKSKKDVITAEIIYYWMIESNIPVEFQKWHLSSLLTLIKVVNLKRQPARKMKAKEAEEQRRALNKARRAKYNSKG